MDLRFDIDIPRECDCGRPNPIGMFDRWIPTEDARVGLTDSFSMNYLSHADDLAQGAVFPPSGESP
jgi:hypothetical protein